MLNQNDAAQVAVKAAALPCAPNTEALSAFPVQATSISHAPSMVQPMQRTPFLGKEAAHA